MGERKGTNKYYPPDFDPSKHRSLDGYHGVHPLRERARKLKSEGILIIRFEMPYNIWCNGCQQPIGMGVRYNAEKTKIGYYYTTPIYQFRMKCAMCDQWFEIKTDPANQDYVIVSGARRKEQRWDATQNEQVVPEERETHKKLISDPMFALEHLKDDVQKKADKLPAIEKLEHRQMKWKDDYELNKAARAKFRGERKHIKAQNQIDKTLLDKSSLDIELLPEHEEDKRLAPLLKYADINQTKSFEERQIEKRKKIENEELFKSPASTSTSPQLQGNKSSRIQQLQRMAFKSKQSETKKNLTSNTLLKSIQIKRKASLDSQEPQIKKLKTKTSASDNNQPETSTNCKSIPIGSVETKAGNEIEHSNHAGLKSPLSNTQPSPASLLSLSNYTDSSSSEEG